MASVRSGDAATPSSTSLKTPCSHIPALSSQIPTNKMQSVLESAVNIAEKVTGKDIDGDGDVGMRAAKVARRGESY